MDELNRFVFYGEWLENIKDLPLDIQDKIIAEIVRYGTNNCRQYEENMMVSMAVNFTKGAIDNAKLEYLKKVNAGKNYGRKKTVDDKAIYELAKQGMKAADIAEQLGISITSVNHSDGWRNRKEEFDF